MGADDYYLTGKYHSFIFSESGENLKYSLMESFIGYCWFPYWASLTYLCYMDDPFYSTNCHSDISH